MNAIIAAGVLHRLSYPGAVLLLRRPVECDYVLLGEDAVLLSRLCGVAVRKYATFEFSILPTEELSGSLDTLLRQGHRVAIVEVAP